MFHWTCIHIWRLRNWHASDRKWYCTPCLMERAEYLRLQKEKGF